MKKSARTLVILIIIILLVTTTGLTSYFGELKAAETMEDTILEEVPVDRLDIRHLGRTLYHKEDKALYFDYTASGAEFYFAGNKLDAQFITDKANVNNKNNQAWIAVFVDNEKEPSRRFPLDSQKKYYNLFESEDNVPVKIRICKLSEAKRGKSGLISMRMNQGATLSKTPDKKKKIEFIGDSITCGYGIEGVNENPFRTSEENGSLTYAAKTAEYFNADYNIVAVSGIGIFSSFTNNNKRNSDLLMSSVYPYTDKLLQIDKKEFPYELWDTTKFKPDLIVINLGVNDDSYVSDSILKRNSFGNNYYKIIHMVRRANPNAEIICAIRDNKEFLYEEIEKQVDKYKSRYKDNKITSMTLPSTTRIEGFGSNGHPNLKTHQRMAEALIKEVEKSIGWSRK